jgi:hypothetical protein
VKAQAAVDAAAEAQDALRLAPDVEARRVRVMIRVSVRRRDAELDHRARRMVTPPIEMSSSAIRGIR